MATQQIVAVRDNAIQAFMPISIVPHVGLATREFTSAVNNPESHFHKHPADFDLYHLGAWDDSSGVFHPLEAPECIVRGVSAKAS